MLLSLAASCFVRQGASEISLTVTEANAEAIELYRIEGYSWCTPSTRQCGSELEPLPSSFQTLKVSSCVSLCAIVHGRI